MTGGNPGDCKSAIVQRLYRRRWWQFWKPKGVVVYLPLVAREPSELLGNPFSREN
jgi:hypothetical protein